MTSSSVIALQLHSGAENLVETQDENEVTRELDSAIQQVTFALKAQAAGGCRVVMLQSRQRSPLIAQRWSSRNPSCRKLKPLRVPIDPFR